MIALKKIYREYTPEKLKQVAKKLTGIPYKHNGRNTKGVDCWGVVFLFFKELGIELPVDDGKYIPDDWYKRDPNRYLRELKQFGKEVGHYDNLKPLDIPYFRLYKNIVTHTSVMIDNTRFLHVLIDKRVSTASMERRFWCKKYEGARRIIKVTDD